MPDGQVVLNHDDAGSRELGERLPPAALAWYGMDRPGRGALEAWVEDGWLMVGGERVVSAEDVRLPGRHMLADVLGAALAARLIGVDASAIANRGAHVRRGPASARDGRRAERRALDQRLAGHDSAGGDRGPRGLRFPDRADRRRQGQGPRLRRIRRRDRVARPRARADRRDRRRARGARRRPRAGEASVVDGRGRAPSPPRSSRPGTSRSCRRRPPASTCSSTMPPAATPSAPPSSGLEESR